MLRDFDQKLPHAFDDNDLFANYNKMEHNIHLYRGRNDNLFILNYSNRLDFFIDKTNTTNYSLAFVLLISTVPVILCCTLFLPWLQECFN